MRNRISVPTSTSCYPLFANLVVEPKPNRRYRDWGLEEGENSQSQDTITADNSILSNPCKVTKCHIQLTLHQLKPIFTAVEEINTFIIWTNECLNTYVTITLQVHENIQLTLITENKPCFMFTLVVLADFFI